MTSGGNVASLDPVAGSWHSRLARIEDVESRLELAERERDPFAESDSYLVRVQRLEARISDLVSESDDRLSLIKGLERELAELTSGREQRDALIQRLNEHVSSLRVTRDDLERLINRQQERITHLSSEVEGTRAVCVELESRVVTQAAQIARLKRSRRRLRTQLADYVRAAIERSVRQVSAAWQRVMGPHAGSAGPVSQTSGPAEQGTL